MKVLRLTLADKTFMTGKITAFISKEALKIQRDSIEIAKQGKEIQASEDEVNIDKVENLLDKLEEIRNKKVWLVCEVYGNQFTPDELEKELSDEEIDAEVNKIMHGVSGIIQKN